MLAKKETVENNIGFFVVMTTTLCRVPLELLETEDLLVRGEREARTASQVAPEDWEPLGLRYLIVVSI